MKLSDDDIREMKRPSDEWRTFQEVAEKFGVSQSTVQYYLVPSTKAKTLERAYRSIEKLGRWEEGNPKRKREYHREYMRRHYHKDPEFREKIKI